jgi:cytochrome c553
MATILNSPQEEHMKTASSRIAAGLVLCLAGIGPNYAADRVNGDPAKAEPIVSQSCAGCHGQDGNSPVPNFPKLAGQHAEYLLRELKAFKAGQRTNEGMQPFMASLSEQDIANLALYFAAQKPAPGEVSKPDLVATGKNLYFNGNPDTDVPSCDGCHEADGHGSGKVPRVAGQNVDYTLDAFKLYAKDTRNNGIKAMRNIAHRLTEQEIEALAQYLASMK